jgi:hypothetical protein
MLLAWLKALLIADAPPAPLPYPLHLGGGWRLEAVKRLEVTFPGEPPVEAVLWLLHCPSGRLTWDVNPCILPHWQQLLHYPEAN